MQVKELISELLEYPMDATIEIIVGDESLSVSEVKQQYGFSEYVKITTDTDDEELINKSELEELRNGLGDSIEYITELQDEINTLNGKIELIVSADE